MSVSPALASSRAHVWLDGLDDWSWPGARPAPEPMPPPWVPTLPPRVALAVPAGYAGGPTSAARRSSPRALVVTLLALIAAALTSTVALEGPRGLLGLVGLDSSTAVSAPAAGAPAADLAAPPARVALVHATPGGGTIESASYPSAALHKRGTFLIYLPPGFSRGGQRYPVLYLLHGHAQRASAFLDLGLAGTLDRLIARRSVPPLIAVMIQGGLGPNNWHDEGARGYESFVLEVQQLVDRMLPSIPTRGARAIAGASMGGYGAMNLALGHPDRFGTVESWLGFFDGLGNELRAARAVIAREGLRAFVYGAASDTIANPSENGPFASALRAAGAKAHAAVYTGEHTMGTLQQHLAHMLTFAGRSLALAVPRWPASQ